jgi:hypothetical protein
MNVSMDLRIEHQPNEQGGGSWMRIGDLLHKEFNERAKRLAMMWQRRTIYETMEAFWPKAASDASQPDLMQEYGRIWMDAPKVLVSNTRRDASHNTRVVGGVGTAPPARRCLRDDLTPTVRTARPMRRSRCPLSAPVPSRSV